MPPINIHNEFEFSGDCCTSCCARCCSDTKPLYVNKQLELESWSRTKANAESLTRTASRVDMLIKDKLSASGVDKDIAYMLVSDKLQIELGKRPITKRDLIAIIKTIQNVHEDLSSEGSNDS